MRSFRLQRQREYLENIDRHLANLRIEAPSAGSFEGWFLGPKAEPAAPGRHILSG
jgi:hypothetical protein